MLGHLRALSWRFEADGRTVWAIAPYGEPVLRLDGTVVYRPRMAAESGIEGWSCVDDCARAALLALEITERDERASTGPDAEATRAAALEWAERWMTFVRYMQLDDGRFANFVLDTTGERNLTGPTSFAGGTWWTGRALWALARYFRITGSEWALAAWARCPIPQLDREGKLLGLFALAGMELLRIDGSTLAPTLRAGLQAEQVTTRALVSQWIDALVESFDGYFRDAPGREGTPLWGYHQLHAVASAARALGRDDLVAPCVATVRNLVEPAIADGGWYALDPVLGPVRNGMTAYCMSSLVQGLAALYDVTGDDHYRTLALDGAEWLYGRNTARAVLYDAETGSCLDGLSGPEGDQPSPNRGAESAIEAGFMELVRRRLATGAGRGQ